MDQMYLVLLALAVLIALGATAIIRDRVRRGSADTTPPDSPFATSTEGMKICPNCGMGNLWTGRQCISCGTALKG
jgi:hypothetical protein